MSLYSDEYRSSLIWYWYACVTVKYFYIFLFLSVFPGYVNMLTISSKDLHMKNSNTKGDSVVVDIEPSKLSR